MCKLSLQDAQVFYAVHQGKPFYPTLTGFISSGRIVAMELVKDGEPQQMHDMQTYSILHPTGCRGVGNELQDDTLD